MPRGFLVAFRDGDRRLDVTGEDADVGRVGEILGEVVERADRLLVAGVGDRLLREIRLRGFGRDDVAGDLRDRARRAAEPFGLAGVVEDVPAADHHEVAFVARFDDTLLELRQLRVALLHLDLATVNTAVLVAPRAERVRRVEQLLVEAEPSGEAGVGEGADLDGVGGDAGVSARGIRLVGRRITAQHAQVAERALLEALASLAAAARRLRGRGRVVGVARVRRLVVAAACAGYQHEDAAHRQPSESCHCSPSPARAR